MKILHLGTGRVVDWYFYPLLQGFQRLGHDLRTFVVPKLPNLESVLVKCIEEYKPDIILTIGVWFRTFDPIIWDILKRYSIPHVYWAIEDSTYFQAISLVKVSEYDLILTISKKCIPEYEKLGKKAFYIPHTIDPDLHKAVLEPDSALQNDIIVTANTFGMDASPDSTFRRENFKTLVEPLIREGYGVKVYGSNWNPEKLSLPAANFGGYLRGTSYIQHIYSGAKIVLGLQRNYDGHICFRTFETLSYGRLLITPYKPVQEEFFTHEKHLIYVRSAEETKEYVDYFLSHPDERNKLALAGQEEVHKNHNCTIRAQQAEKAMHDSGII